MLALRDSGVPVGRLRLVPGAGQLREAQPLEPRAPAQLVDGRVVRDPVEPRQDPLVARHPGQRAEGLGEGLLDDVVRELGIGGEAEEEGVHAHLVRAVDDLERGRRILARECEDLDVRRRARHQIDGIAACRLGPEGRERERRAAGGAHR